MKYIYIAGLEHSGTTLADFLLSQMPSAIGLGEVASFFSPEHMRQYMKKYGRYDDVRLCSCGSDWSDCDFWSTSEAINGLNSTLPMIEKYQQLFQMIKHHYLPGTIIVDSSKSLETLRKILENRNSLGLHGGDFIVVFAFKDPRGFAASIARKTGNHSLRATLASFNWWLSSNRQMLEFLLESDVPYMLSSYEELCANPDQLLASINVSDTQEACTQPGMSHIAMGNKNFALRESHHITYDDAWKKHVVFKLMYKLHWPAFRFHRALLQKATLVGLQ